MLAVLLWGSVARPLFFGPETRECDWAPPLATFPPPHSQQPTQTTATASKRQNVLQWNWSLDRPRLVSQTVQARRQVGRQRLNLFHQPFRSGTNGYIIRNMAHARPRDDNYRETRDKANAREAKLDRQPDQGILDHERKRKVEVKCMELRMALEDRDMPETEIEEQVIKLRAKLNQALADVTSGFGERSRDEIKSLRPSDVHALAAAKELENRKMANALGLPADYQAGDSFNSEVQERRKRERIEAREAKRTERQDRQRAWQERQQNRRDDRSQGPARISERRPYDDDRRGYDERRGHDSRRRSPSPPPRSTHRAQEHDGDRRGPPSLSTSPPPRRRDSPPLKYDEDREQDYRSRSRSHSRSPPARYVRRDNRPARHEEDEEPRLRRPVSRSPSLPRQDSHSPPRRERPRFAPTHKDDHDDSAARRTAAPPGPPPARPIRINRPQENAEGGASRQSPSPPRSRDRRSNSTSSSAMSESDQE